jgi:radical SAM protein with 4Fe4S-binding SPASM domain
MIQIQEHEQDYACGKNGTLLKGYSYSFQEIHTARDTGKLLCMRIETNYACDLDCLYCYSFGRQNSTTPPMSLRDACDVIDQGVELGFQSVVYLGGGEPFLYKDFWPFLEHIHRRKLTAVIFTNGMSLDATAAKRLFDLGTSLMIKSDGSEKTQNWLTGPGSYKRIVSGLNAALETGFATLNGRFTRLGIAPCATKVNIREIPELWRFARKNNIFPNVEYATKIGRASSNITLEGSQIRWLTSTLRDIDSKEFGIKWSTPHSSTPGHSCGIFLAGVAIMVDGGVGLCPEMPPVAYLAGKPLAEIMRDPAFLAARALEENIDEPCASCEYLKFCLGGCRSKALVCSNSYFACDPFCNLQNDKQEDNAVVKNLESQVPQLNSTQLVNALAKQFFISTETKPFFCILVIFSDQSSSTEKSFNSKRRSIERILKIHLREDDRIFRLDEFNSYLLTLRNCGSKMAKKLFQRLENLLRSEISDTDIELKMTITSYDNGDRK